jgi:hypothetical protein
MSAYEKDTVSPDWAAIAAAREKEKGYVPEASLIEMRAWLSERDAERQERRNKNPADVGRAMPAELLKRKIIRALDDATVTAFVIRDLIDTITLEGNWGFLPPDTKAALEAKLEDLAAVPTMRSSHMGGRPAKFGWDDFWIEIVRIALMEGELPERDALRQRMLDWISHWPNQPEAGEIRKRLKRLYDTPGIIP